MFKVENTARMLLVVMAVGVLTLPAKAQANELDYPEISIVPRYSDRLEAEAKMEPLRKWGAVATLAIPFAASTVVGVTLFNPQMAVAYWTPLAVGGLGLVGMSLFGVFLQPYNSGMAIVSPLKNGTLREKLYRERVAEEQIEAAARMGNRMRWFSTAVNLAANMFTVVSYTQVTDSFLAPGQKMMGVIAGGVGALLSFTPLLFPPYWVDVAGEQESYRKRIFSPVASATVFPVGGDLLPGMMVGFQF